MCISAIEVAGELSWVIWVDIVMFFVNSGVRRGGHHAVEDVDYHG